MDQRDKQILAEFAKRTKAGPKGSNWGLISLGMNDVFRLWTDKENLEKPTIVNRREREEKSIPPFTN